MSYIEIVLLAIGLCFDTLAVSVVQGSCNRNMTLGQRVTIELTFGLVQALFIFGGWVVGSSFLTYIENYDHWLAFFLLLFIGVSMIVDCLKGDNDDEHNNMNLLSFWPRLVAAVATSIDALAVGISMAMMQGFGWTKIGVTFVIVAVITAATAALGLTGGKLAARILGKRNSLIGGIILIGIGVKILIEHLYF